MTPLRKSDYQFCIGILQLTRIGDVLQTLQASSALKVQYPNVRLVLIARVQFAKGLEKILKDVFDEIYYLDYNSLSKSADVGEYKQGLSKLIAEINLENFDLLVNLSFSTSSSYFASLINAKSKMGLKRGRKNEIQIEDRVSQYIFSTVMNGAHNPFNLVDLYRRMLGADQLPLVYEASGPATKKVIIHPFASHQKKKWGMSKWSETIYQLLKQMPEIQIEIIGGTADLAELSLIQNMEALKNFQTRISYVVGSLSLAETFDRFNGAILFIGHDSMGGHMAALNSVPSITLSLGTVRPHETTPYAHRNYNLAPKTKCFPCFPSDQCDLLPCHADITYQLVVRLAQNIINQEEISLNSLKQNISQFHLENVHIYESFLDPEHGIILKDLLGPGLEMQNLFRSFYHVLWSYTFFEKDLKLSKPLLNSQTLSQLANYEKGLDYLFELNNFGQRYSNYIVEEIKANSPRLNHIKEYSQKLAEIDELAKTLKQTYPLLAPLIDFYFVAKSNFKGNNIKELAESSYVTYFEFNNSVQVMSELVKYCLSDARAKLVRTKSIDN